MKRKCCFLLLLLFVFCPVLWAGETGWTPLFNGKNLEGWQKLNGRAMYEVKDGIIIGKSRLNTPNTFLATVKEYSDFILEYEAKIDSGLNSGVQIRSLSDPQYRDGRVHGYQVEIDPSLRSWSGGIYDEARRGWLYNLEYNPKAKKAFNRKAWNHFRVEAIGNQIRVWLNSVPAVDLIDDMTAKGFIALQVHGIKGKEELEDKTVKFRNIRIRTADLQQFGKEMPKSVPQVSYLTNRLTAREKEEGWKLLWDGSSAKGWRSAVLDRFPRHIWTIENGELMVTKGSGRGRYGGDIITEKKYGNFILELDFKFGRGANSGIKYIVTLQKNGKNRRAVGCEYQILDDDGHADAQKGVGGNRTLASLYDLIPADARFYTPHERQKRVNKKGWNRARIVVNGKRVEHYLNGIKVVQYRRGTQMWRALKAKSKYSKWPHFGEQEEGYILLQDHGYGVAFRNIKIKPLQ